MSLLDYRIDFRRELGRGAFGIVYEARLKTENTRGYCAKLFTNARGSSDEIEILKYLSGFYNLRNIAKIAATGTVGDQMKPIIIMEKLRGGEVFHAIVSKGRFSEMKAARCLINLMTGLHDLHRIAGVIHRDVKPENLVFTDDSDRAQVKLIDFGLAIRLDPEDIDRGVCITTKVPVGTQGYMSPETLAYFKYSSKTDVWAAGVTLYSLLSGIFPFDQSDLERQTSQILEGSFYSMKSQYWQNISDEAKDLVRKMLTTRPSLRPSVEEVLCHPWVRRWQNLTPTSELCPDVGNEFGPQYIQRIRRLMILKKFKKIVNSIIWTMRVRAKVLEAHHFKAQIGYEDATSDTALSSYEDDEEDILGSFLKTSNDVNLTESKAQPTMPQFSREDIRNLRYRFKAAADAFKARCQVEYASISDIDNSNASDGNIHAVDGVDYDGFVRVMNDVGLITLARPHVFKMFDSDGNGVVEYREFLMALVNLCGTSDNVIHSYFDIFDLDGSGYITSDEMQYVLASILVDRSHSKGGPSNVIEIVENALKESGADAENESEVEASGPGEGPFRQISRDIFHFSVGGEEHTSFESLFSALDIDHDGQISFEEFKKWVESDGNFLQSVIVDAFKFTQVK